MQIFLSEQASNDEILVIILSFYFVSIQLSSVWVHKSAILHLQDSTSSAWEISIGSLSQKAWNHNTGKQ